MLARRSRKEGTIWVAYGERCCTSLSFSVYLLSISLCSVSPSFEGFNPALPAEPRNQVAFSPRGTWPMTFFGYRYVLDVYVYKSVFETTNLHVAAAL